VVVTGVWGAKLAWDMELGAAHTLAICIIFWGLTLIAAEVLPRVGYAQVQQPWFCA
jgi:heme A synthase